MKHRFLTVLILSAIVAFVFPVKSNAAEKIDIDKSTITVPYQETCIVEVKYSGAFSDLAVQEGEASKVLTALTDSGNGKAKLFITYKDFGQTLVAVYSMSDMTNVDYILVKSGLTNGNEIKNYINFSDITTVYNNCLIKYNAFLFGENDAVAAVNGLVLSREKGMDELNVTANIIKDDSIMSGLGTFKASFYDMNDNLIKTQKSFVRTNLNRESNICWYIPKDCVTIVLE